MSIFRLMNLHLFDLILWISLDFFVPPLCVYEKHTQAIDPFNGSFIVGTCTHTREEKERTRKNRQKNFANEIEIHFYYYLVRILSFVSLYVLCFQKKLPAKVYVFKRNRI